MTIPLVRRIVDRSLAASLAISVLAVPGQPLPAAESPSAELPAAEQGPAVVLEIHGDGIPVPHLRLEPASTAMTETVPESAAPATTTAPPPRTAVIGTAPGPASTRNQPPAADTYTVVAGDNLWLIAESHVGTAEDGPPTEQAVAAYWRDLIDSNIANLRSGDPNLIYPGEILRLPKYEVQP
jgi:nucleoid-associated protein YgaU